jgi:cytochrome c553
MTLLQANAEAVARHYRLEDPLPAAAALTAYLTWLGTGLPISPGVSVGQPVFPDRMRALAASADRGSRLFARRCLRCHETADIAPAATAFPRVVGGQPETLEGFLESHPILSPPLPWGSPGMADLIAYLVSCVKGLPISLAIDPDRAMGNKPTSGPPS